MGMYTEIFVNCEIKKDIPLEVREALSYLFGDGEMPKKLPKHEFFSKERWEMIGKCCSYYFTPFSTTELRFDNISKSYYIISRSDLKNYDGEIEAFFDWIMPYIANREGSFIGYSRYEEDETPTIYLKKENIEYE